VRDLSSNIYTAKVRDGDEVHTLTYRRPTNQEHAAYGASLTQRKGGKLINRVMETRLKFGLRILVGFEKGTMGFQGQLISSDPEDSDYYSDWKNLLEQAVPDIVSAIGRQAFEGTQVVTPDDFDLDSEIESLVTELDEVEPESDPSISKRKSKTS
jgi:hypothetical protein